ncbi:hypothetical protein CPC08DRAFT_714470 [Agrocybe pediades]|nr:hypothetical protein CPC08DRAFT_714470 [Agrocybe pediades]
MGQHQPHRVANSYCGTGQSVVTRSVASNAGDMSTSKEGARWKAKASGKTRHVVWCKLAQERREGDEFGRVQTLRTVKEKGMFCQKASNQQPVRDRKGIIGKKSCGFTREVERSWALNEGEELGAGARLESQLGGRKPGVA